MNIFKKEPNFKFLEKRYFAFAFSGLIIVAGLLMYLKNGFNMGIDFTGGTMVEVIFKDPTSVPGIRNALRGENMGEAQITQIGKENKFFIKTMTISGKQMAEETMEDHEIVARKIRRALWSDEERKMADAGRIDLNNNAAGEVSRFLQSKGINEDDADEAANLIINYRKSSKEMLRDFSEVEKLGIKLRIASTLKSNAFVGNYSMLSVEIVGPQVGRDLRRKATLACIWALIGMLLYIAFRFKFLFGLSGVLTLLHDVLVSLAFIVFFRIEMSLQVIAALLTIVGYSINDTIVIFDRLRDNLKIMRKEDFLNILNKTINQTLSRTIITSLTVFLTVLALYLFGGEVIRPFAFVMIVGVICGSYSTIYQSCAWLKVWERSLLGRKNV